MVPPPAAKSDEPSCYGSRGRHESFPGQEVVAAVPAAELGLSSGVDLLNLYPDTTAIEALSNRVADAVDVETQVGQQLAALAVLDETIRNAQPHHAARVQLRLVGRLQQCAAEAALQRSLLDRHHQR